MSKVFLSYNVNDRAFATELAGGLHLLGADVWFDQWSMIPGDSIPESVGLGITSADVFCLVWSERARDSRWIAAELNAALMRVVASQTRIVPVVLDSAPLPALVASIKYVLATGKSPFAVAQEVLGLHTPAQVRIAVQAVLDRAGMAFQEYWGVGVLVGCPKCGADLDSIKGYHTTDDVYDRSYAGAMCTVCGWDEGSET